MSKPFDATLKELIDNNPDDWVRLAARSLGLPNGIKAEAIDADLVDRIASGGQTVPIVRSG